MLLCCILWVIKKAINKKINISDKSIDKYIKIIIILIYIGIKLIIYKIKSKNVKKIGVYLYF